jgi:hypothetical protein
VALSSFCTEYLARIANTYFFAGHLLDCESFYYFRFLSNALGICNVNVHIGSDSDLRLSYLVSKSLSSLFNDSTVFLIIGLNLKLESPLLNIRLKNSMFATHARVRIGYIGTHIFSNYPIIHLGFCSTALSFFFFGRSFFCYDVDNVICLTGGSVSTIVSSVLRTLSDTAFSTNYIALYSGDINLHELCVLQSFNARSLYTLKSERSFIYLVGSDFARHLYTSNSFVVYQGHHHEAINFVPNLVLPTNSFTEVEGLFVNCQGKYQISSQVISSAGTVLMCEDLTFALYKMVCGRSSDFAYKSVTRMKAKFLPYSVNYISSFSTCSYLQSKRTDTHCYLLGALFYIFLRNYYDTDIITRSNSDFYALRYAYNTVHNYA